MATAIKMPQLGVTMTEAKVVSWLKREGDAVRKGDAVATIETDKINAEVEASADGVLRRIVAPEGTVVPVVGLMAVIAAPAESEAAIEALLAGQGGRSAGPPAAAVAGPVPGEIPAEPPAAAPPASSAPPATRTAPPATVPSVAVAERPTTAAPTSELRASPIARRLAADLNVDLAQLRGSGPSGRIVEADVRTAAEAPPPVAPQGPGTTDGFVRASPLARRLAREHELDLGAIRGTGPEGRVVERDVLATIADQLDQARREPSLPTEGAERGAGDGELTRRETIKLEGIRRLVAGRMLESLQTTAQLTLTLEADATALVDLRGHLVPAAKVYGLRPPTYTDLLVYLVARVLPAHPLLNSSLVGEGEGQEIALWQEVNLGVAVALERGLVVPVIKGADRKPLQDISQELADMAERARAGRLAMVDLQGGTFTITNLGGVEVEGFTPIINPPQCAILGVGRIARKPAVVGDEVVARHMVTLSLTFDHRIVDGFPAGAFLRDVKRAIEAPSL